jgi:hypothetical protein
MSYRVECIAALLDVRLAECGITGNASLIDTPAAAAVILGAQGAADVTGAAATAKARCRRAAAAAVMCCRVVTAGHMQPTEAPTRVVQLVGYG